MQQASDWENRKTHQKMECSEALQNTYIKQCGTMVPQLVKQHKFKQITMPLSVFYHYNGIRQERGKQAGRKTHQRPGHKATPHHRNHDYKDQEQWETG